MSIRCTTHERGPALRVALVDVDHAAREQRTDALVRAFACGNMKSIHGASGSLQNGVLVPSRIPVGLAIVGWELWHLWPGLPGATSQLFCDEGQNHRKRRWVLWERDCRFCGIKFVFFGRKFRRPSWVGGATRSLRGAGGCVVNMASVSVSRFGVIMRSSGGAVMRVMRERLAAGTPALAVADRVAGAAGGSNKRCVSTIGSESHDYLTKVREGLVCLLLLAPLVWYLPNSSKKEKI